MSKIFIVEDDTWYANFLEHHISKNEDFDIEIYQTGQELLDQIHLKPQIICLDYSLPDYQASELLKIIERAKYQVSIILISAQNDIKKAIDILKYDCVYDYIVKDDDVKERLWKSVHALHEKNQLQKEVEDLRDQLEKTYDFDQKIIGSSLAIQKAFKLMHKATDNTINVSITGETGTGKDLAAQCIHYNSNRAKKPFVAVNITAIPADLLESELFGHEKGAFTGAHSKRVGKFEEAHKGTIFLDEIGDMDLSLQTRLLRVLQEREIVRLGSNNPIKVDVRLIVATHKNLAEQVKKGLFREDLYFRLLGLSIEIPALRNRKEDIIVLSEHFIKQFCSDNKKPIKKLSAKARKKLVGYDYPGNIRELKAVIELAVVMSDDKEIQEEDIVFNNSNGFSDMISTQATLKEITAKIIRHHLDKNNQNVHLVAKQLDIGKSTLYRMIKTGEV